MFVNFIILLLVMFICLTPFYFGMKHVLKTYFMRVDEHYDKTVHDYRTSLDLFKTSILNTVRDEVEECIFRMNQLEDKIEELEKSLLEKKSKNVQDEQVKIEPSYICKGCALKNGAVVVKGHAAISHKAVCPYCKKVKYLSHTSDWDWPENKELEEGRDI